MNYNNTPQDLFSYNNQPPLPNGKTIMVLGIISIATCFLYGLPSIICGIIALVLAKKDNELYNLDPNKYSLESFSNLKTGRTCAIIGLILGVLCLLVMVAYLIFFLTFFQDMIKNMPRH